MMLYGYKSTIGIALGTLKLSANICRHKKCRRSLTEPTSPVSAKVCTVKRKKNPQNILPLSPSRLHMRPIHARPASAPAAAASHRRQPSSPPTPSLAAAASHAEPRRRSLPCQRPPPPSCTAPPPVAVRRNPNHGCPIAYSSASTQDVAHPRSPSVAALDLRAFDALLSSLQHRPLRCGGRLPLAAGLAEPLML